MPLYEYRCDNCGATEEAIQKVDAKPLKICSQCGGHLHKLMSSPAIQFKGSGWYVTDYASKKKQPAASTQTSKKPEPKKTKSEDKSATVSKSSSPTPTS